MYTCHKDYIYLSSSLQIHYSLYRFESMLFSVQDSHLVYRISFGSANLVTLEVLDLEMEYVIGHVSIPYEAWNLLNSQRDSWFREHMDTIPLYENQQGYFDEVYHINLGAGYNTFQDIGLPEMVGMQNLPPQAQGFNYSVPLVQENNLTTLTQPGTAGNPIVIGDDSDDENTPTTSQPEQQQQPNLLRSVSRQLFAPLQEASVDLAEELGL